MRPLTAARYLPSVSLGQSNSKAPGRPTGRERVWTPGPIRWFRCRMQTASFHGAVPPQKASSHPAAHPKPRAVHLWQFPYLGRSAVPRRTHHRGPHTAPLSLGRSGIVLLLQRADLLKMGTATGHAVRQLGSRSSSEGRYCIFFKNKMQN